MSIPWSSLRDEEREQDDFRFHNDADLSSVFCVSNSKIRYDSYGPFGFSLLIHLIWLYLWSWTHLAKNMGHSSYIDKFVEVSQQSWPKNILLFYNLTFSLHDIPWCHIWKKFHLLTFCGFLSYGDCLGTKYLRNVQRKKPTIYWW